MNGITELLPGIFLIPGSTNIGAVIVRSGASCSAYLVDSGTDEHDAERIYDALRGICGGPFTLKAVICTHSHADHAGGCAFFARTAHCGIWMPYLEKGSMENTLLQSSVAWGGSPLPELRTPYYVPEQCGVTRTVSEKDTVALEDGKTITFLPLPGHYFGMLGAVCTVADGRRVLFAGDAVFSRNVIGKFSIPFMFDPGAFKRTLDMLCSFDAAWYVPSHGDPVQRIQETAEMNKIAVLETETCITDILEKKPMTAEELLTAVADRNCIPMKVAQYVLIGSTIRSYLSYMYAEKRVSFRIEDNRMIWSSVTRRT